MINEKKRGGKNKIEKKDDGTTKKLNVCCVVLKL